MLKENDILKLYKRAKREKKERLQKNFNNIRIDIRFSKKNNSYNVNIFIYKNKKYEKIGTADIVIVNNNYKIKNLKELNKAINEFLLSDEEKKEEPLNFSLYIEDFLNYIDTMNIGDSKKRQKKKYVYNNLKTFLENNVIKDEKNIVNYLNYCIKNAKSFGVSKTYNSNNCYTLKNNMTVLKDFFKFLFINSKINKEMFILVKNFSFNDYFTNCKNIKNKNYHTFNTLDDLKNFYNVLICSKCFIIDKLEEYIEDFEYLTFLSHLENIYDYEELKEIGEQYVYLKNFSKKSLLNILTSVLSLEILNLTGMRKSDLLKLNDKNKYIYDKNEFFIIFKTSKNKEDYTLYLTSYLKELFDLLFFIKDNFIIKLSEQNMKRYLYYLFEIEAIEYIHIHGLRHSFKSFALEYLNIDNAIIEIQMGHKLKGVQEHYRITDLKHKRLDLLEKWEFLIKKSKSEDIANILNSRKRIYDDVFNFLKDMKIKYDLDKKEILKIMNEL